MNDLDNLQKARGVSFKAPSLLRQALTHSSFVNENPGATSNERLEFLGDAVLGLVMAEALYRMPEGAAEGEMTRARATLVNQNTLYRVAQGIKLGDYLYLGKGEEGGGRGSAVNLASALEAVIAAVFLDQGFESARSLVLRLFGEEIKMVLGAGSYADGKSQLQEFVQAQKQGAPTYRLVSDAGPAHDRVFTVAVVVDGTVLGWGSGKTKKAAEMEAARQALVRLTGKAEK